MADKMKLGQSAYCKAEKGYRSFTLEQIEIAAREFSLSWPEFFIKAFSRDYNLTELLSNCLNALSEKEGKAISVRLQKELRLHTNMLGSTVLLLECLSRMDFF